MHPQPLTDRTFFPQFSAKLQATGRHQALGVIQSTVTFPGAHTLCLLIFPWPVTKNKQKKSKKENIVSLLLPRSLCLPKIRDPPPLTPDLHVPRAVGARPDPERGSSPPGPAWASPLLRGVEAASMLLPATHLTAAVLQRPSGLSEGVCSDAGPGLCAHGSHRLCCFLCPRSLGTLCS